MVDNSNIRIVVERVRVEGAGAILLTGPSSCGKGEVAKSICRFLSLPEDRHLSMGSILRKTILHAREDEAFCRRLADDYGISDDVPVADASNDAPALAAKVKRYAHDLPVVLGSQRESVSQLDWLEYCVKSGLLIPDDWAEQIIHAHLSKSTDLRDAIFILDGYPRTKVAAERLLKTFSQLGIDVIQVLHLSVTKDQMKTRALARSRSDDTDEVLERRYQFYVDHVQPCVDFLKEDLGTGKVALIDAHQPVYNSDGALNLEQSIRNVALAAMEALGLPQYLLDMRSGSE